MIMEEDIVEYDDNIVLVSDWDCSFYIMKRKEYWKRILFSILQVIFLRPLAVVCWRTQEWGGEGEGKKFTKDI